jgi:hypothetical protein
MREIKAMRVTDQILQHGSTLAFYFFSVLKRKLHSGALQTKHSLI